MSYPAIVAAISARPSAPVASATARAAGSTVEPAWPGPPPSSKSRACADVPFARAACDGGSRNGVPQTRLPAPVCCTLVRAALTSRASSVRTPASATASVSRMLSLTRPTTSAGISSNGRPAQCAARRSVSDPSVSVITPRLRLEVDGERLHEPPAAGLPDLGVLLDHDGVREVLDQEGDDLFHLDLREPLSEAVVAAGAEGQRLVALTFEQEVRRAVEARRVAVGRPHRHVDV